MVCETRFDYEYLPRRIDSKRKSLHISCQKFDTKNKVLVYALAIFNIFVILSHAMLQFNIIWRNNYASHTTISIP